MKNVLKSYIGLHKDFSFLKILLWILLVFYPLGAPCQGSDGVILSANFSTDRAVYFQNKEYIIKEKDTLVDLAVAFKVGYQHLVSANPGIDPWVPPPGQKILIPYQVIIPQDFLLPERTYILINLPEMRLYFFDANKLYVFPVGIADEGKISPEGTYTIVRKKEKPTWYPPPSILAEDPSLPKVVPPGPDNPLGDYALYLDRGNYLIHGTNKEESVGRRTTHGCFRLYREHIAFLYHNVPLKTKVFIVYQPIKVAIEGKKIFLQVFPDFEKRVPNPFYYVLRKLSALAELRGEDFRLNLLKLEEALERADGLVYEVGRLTKPSSQTFSSREKR
ncbi:MAG: L,D-transpeptidase family protein [Thermodesulfobacteriaceae bacterium]|jgi:L,D-transpeptidase ErfK/SrfK